VYQEKQLHLEEQKFIKIKIMSIGNLKNSGNQGNNFPWQLKMLEGLQAIYDEVSEPLTCIEDSVTICNANIDAFTFTNIGGNDALNVNIAGGVTLEVNLDAANDQVGIYGYVNGASGSPVPLNVNASGQVAIQDGGNSITVDGGTGLLRTTGILRPIGGPASNVNVVAPGGFYSVSVANVGAANGSILGGVANIKPGEVLNFSADAINNFFNSFAYDATGTEFIIIYVS
jgi:hypothetical protein